MEKNTEQKAFALGKENLILLAIGVGLIVLGFLLMLGSSSGLKYDPTIFSFRRIGLAPTVCLSGYLLILFAILKKPKNKE
jgi:hypothetical protein